ncbi:MAG: LemA family protein [Desulfobacterales bacterium]|nr:LemA family protein [Desulfobacterales bacterium]
MDSRQCPGRRGHHCGIDVQQSDRQEKPGTKVFVSVDALLKKRYDLIPNLVSAVQTYMQHEKALLTELLRCDSEQFPCRFPMTKKSTWTTGSQGSWVRLWSPWKITRT